VITTCLQSMYIDCKLVIFISNERVFTTSYRQLIHILVY